MPRKRRFYQPGVPAHVFQRGHNQQPVFFGDADYLAYLRFLKASADALGCQVHAYVLMTNHVHLLITPKAENDISLLFQNIGRHFVSHINKTYQRRGSLWEGRHKGNILESEAYFLACMRYIEMNPVRAGMADQFAYRELFATLTQPDELELIRTSLHSGTPLGNNHFKQQIESVAGCSVGFSKRGRPLKNRLH